MNAGDILTASQADYVVQLEQLRDLVEEIAGRSPGWLPVIDRKLETCEWARYFAIAWLNSPRPTERASESVARSSPPRRVGRVTPMYCINCGKTLIEGANFCGVCGAAVVEETGTKDSIA